MASNQEGRQINSASQSPKIPHSHFTLNKRFGLTTKFGVNVPIYAKEFVPDDGPVTIEPNCDIRSYTLKAPMIGTINKHISFYQVPLQCILPFNSDKIVKIPNRGTDVAGETSVTGIVPCLDGVNTVISDFAYRIYSSFSSDFDEYIAAYGVPPTTESSEFGTYLRDSFFFILKYEMFLSQGSLISHLGAHYSSMFRLYDGEDERYYSFDEFCELILTNLSKYRFTVYDEGGHGSNTGVGTGVKFVRRVLDFCRSHKGPFSFVVDSFVGSTVTSLQELEIVPSFTIQEGDTEPYNYLRCCAYQIVNAHYFTNDKVDYINTAELYRQFICSFITSNYGAEYFTYNGVDTPFDYLSGHYFNIFLNNYLSSTSLDDIFFTAYYPLISAVFGFNYSLRYMDYFVGARPKNLAVGDTTIRVDNNTVQVVDVTKNIVKQRLLNAVGRIGNTIEEYSEKILGHSLAYDFHNPKYLFSFDANVFTSEVENTGAAQTTEPNSVTSVLRGSFKNHRFTFSVDRFSVIIGIEYTDFARFYYTTQDRNTMAIDRFDMFVPELQYVGDQELRRSELFAGSIKEQPFGYTLRDMQFKQDIDECAGGFIDFLPGWLFLFNPYERNMKQLSDITISPEFIRSQPTELDDFYLSLTNMSLAGYFHFIEMWDIKVSANRPMAYAPQIL